MAADGFALLSELDAWDAASRDERVALAEAVANSLPSPFVYEGLATYALGGCLHEIARFSHGEQMFSLIPGSTSALLGYDREHPFDPTPAQAKEWLDAYGEPAESLHECLNEFTSPLRRVAIAPLLVEIVAQEFDYAAMGDAQADAYREALEALEEGFRLPTTDEREYFAAAGTRTIFRWGDDSPSTCSDGESQWELHQRPNAFGLLMNSSTYTIELCEGPAFRGGGDGGCAVCGGASGFATWLPLASWFALPEEIINDWWIDDVVVRRVRAIEL